MVRNMRRKRRKSNCLSLFSAVMLSAILTACGAQDKGVSAADHANQQEEISLNNEDRDSRLEKGTISDIDLEDKVEGSTPENNDSTEKPSEEDTVSETDSEDEVEKPIPNDDGSLEIYSAREVISLSDDMIVGQVALEDILLGNPILYDRVLIDGFVFEWILTDYENEDEYNYSFEEGVLIISKEDDAEYTQVIHTQGEGGGWGPPASLSNKFEYMDVNFDDIPDLLICTGHHGNQGAVTYYCFLKTDAGFVEAPTFTEIANPSVDTENKLILSQWRNSAVSHSWAEYKYQDNAYVLYRELREDAEAPEGAKDASDYIWVWTVNGEVIGRSGELSELEIVDLLFNENSEWRIADDRWRTIYNNGMTADYSIYNEP